MPGPRQDKARAWLSLEEMLTRCCKMAELISQKPDKPRVAKAAEDVRHALGVLKTSGRMDARQVHFVRKLLEALWRMRSYAGSEGCASEAEFHQGVRLVMPPPNEEHR